MVQFKENVLIVSFKKRKWIVGIKKKLK